jgi:hypothetical protein
MRVWDIKGDTQMEYEVVYENRGDRIPCGRVALTTNDLATAEGHCRQLIGPLAQAIRYAITCDDGRTLWDTRKDGLMG